MMQTLSFCPEMVNAQPEGAGGGKRWPALHQAVQVVLYNFEIPLHMCDAACMLTHAFVVCPGEFTSLVV